MEFIKAKGTRDYFPEEKILRDEIISKAVSVFEKYGFYPLETPVIERFETLASKYGGEEIKKEIFLLSDQGGRKLGLKFDNTVPLARFISENPNIKMPFKRYQIDRLFRDGPVRKGRLREFWQMDADIVGVEGIYADIEIINLLSDFFESVGLDAEIRINSRKILDAIMEKIEVPEKSRDSFILSMDKLEKQREEYVKKELEEKGFSKNQIKGIFDFMKIKKIDEIAKKIPCDEFDKIKKIVSTSKKCVFDITLARGLNYYTGIVFEAVLKKDTDLHVSLAGGGRYDRMIGDFVGKGKKYPAIGFAIGLEPVFEILKEKFGKKGLKKSKTAVLIAPIGDSNIDFAYKTAAELRKENLSVDFDILGRSPSKNIDYASDMGIKYVLFIGDNERKGKVFRVKDLSTGKESDMKFDALLKFFGVF